MGLPILKSGALVLAWNQEQLAQLPELIKNARINDVNDVAILSREITLVREPGLSDAVVDGFEVPGKCLIDPRASAHAYLLQAIANGATLSRGTEVLGGEFSGDSWNTKTSKSKISADHVISCSGLYGDIVDEHLIGERNFSVIPRKGQFVVFDKAASDLVASIILPVPTKKTKGVVVCRTILATFW